MKVGDLDVSHKTIVIAFQHKLHIVSTALETVTIILTLFEVLISRQLKHDSISHSEFEKRAHWWLAFEAQVF